MNCQNITDREYSLPFFKSNYDYLPGFGECSQQCNQSLSHVRLNSDRLRKDEGFLEKRVGYWVLGKKLLPVT